MPIHWIFGNRVMLLGTRGQRGQTPALGHTARPTLPSLHSVSSQPQMPLGGDLLFLTWSVDTSPFYSPGRRPGFPISKGSFLKKWSSSCEKERPDLSEGPGPISYFSPEAPWGSPRPLSGCCTYSHPWRFLEAPSLNLGHHAFSKPPGDSQTLLTCLPSPALLLAICPLT